MFCSWHVKLILFYRCSMHGCNYYDYRTNQWPPLFNTIIRSYLIATEMPVFILHCSTIRICPPFFFFYRQRNNSSILSFGFIYLFYKRSHTSGIQDHEKTNTYRVHGIALRAMHASTASHIQVSRQENG
jgi:hypothetical protein